VSLVTTETSTWKRAAVRHGLRRLHSTHGIPKTTDDVGERISLAFRLKPPRRVKAEET
jgi:hypothetical protein